MRPRPDSSFSPPLYHSLKVFSPRVPILELVHGEEVLEIEEISHGLPRVKSVSGPGY